MARLPDRDAPRFEVDLRIAIIELYHVLDACRLAKHATERAICEVVESQVRRGHEDVCRRVFDNAISARGALRRERALPAAAVALIAGYFLARWSPVIAALVPVAVVGAFLLRWPIREPPQYWVTVLVPSAGRKAERLWLELRAALDATGDGWADALDAYERLCSFASAHTGNWIVIGIRVRAMRTLAGQQPGPVRQRDFWARAWRDAEQLIDDADLRGSESLGLFEILRGATFELSRDERFPSDPMDLLDRLFARRPDAGAYHRCRAEIERWISSVCSDLGRRIEALASGNAASDRADALAAYDRLVHHAHLSGRRVHVRAVGRATRGLSSSALDAGDRALIERLLSDVRARLTALSEPAEHVETWPADRKRWIEVLVDIAQRSAEVDIVDEALELLRSIERDEKDDSYARKARRRVERLASSAPTGALAEAERLCARLEHHARRTDKRRSLREHAFAARAVGVAAALAGDREVLGRWFDDVRGRLDELSEGGRGRRESVLGADRPVGRRRWIEALVEIARRCPDPDVADEALELLRTVERHDKRDSFADDERKEIERLAASGKPDDLAAAEAAYAHLGRHVQSTGKERSLDRRAAALECLGGAAVAAGDRELQRRLLRDVRARLDELSSGPEAERGFQRRDEKLVRFLSGAAQRGGDSTIDTEALALLAAFAEMAPYAREHHERLMRRRALLSD